MCVFGIKNSSRLLSCPPPPPPPLQSVTAGVCEPAASAVGAGGARGGGEGAGSGERLDPGHTGSAAQPHGGPGHPAV